MKGKISVLFIIIICCLLNGGCSGEGSGEGSFEGSIKEGSYRLNVERVAPSIQLVENKYTLYEPSYSSVYEPEEGTYTINDEYLILTPSDSKETFSFKIVNDKIIYDKEASSANELFSKYDSLNDGDEFSFIDNQSEK